MIDFQATADILYPTKAPEAPVVPPVEATTTTETGGTKTAEPRAADDTHTTADQTKLTEQPTDVPYALTLPEDAVIEASAIERTMAFAKAAGLSPEAAQKALEHANGEVVAYRDQQTEAWRTLTRETWVNEVKNDPEIVGAVPDAQQFVREFADPEILEFLEKTGYGNHKLFIRLGARVMKRMANDTLPAGSGATPKSDAEVLYGNTPRR